MKKISPSLINIFILQAGWWSITLSYPNQFIYLPMSLLLLVLHLFLSEDKRKETLFIFLGLLISCSFDLLALKMKLWSPTSTYTFFPLWLVCYWLVFLTSFSQSLNWLKNKTAFTGLLGFVFGPLSYYAGEKFSILNFNHIGNYDKAYSLIAYGLIWAVNYIILFKIFKKIKP